MLKFLYAFSSKVIPTSQMRQWRVAGVIEFSWSCSGIGASQTQSCLAAPMVLLQHLLPPTSLQSSERF